MWKYAYIIFIHALNALRDIDNFINTKNAIYYTNENFIEFFFFLFCSWERQNGYLRNECRSFWRDLKYAVEKSLSMRWSNCKFLFIMTLIYLSYRVAIIKLNESKPSELLNGLRDEVQTFVVSSWARRCCWVFVSENVAVKRVWAYIACEGLLCEQ